MGKIIGNENERAIGTSNDLGAYRGIRFNEYQHGNHWGGYLNFSKFKKVLHSPGHVFGPQFEADTPARKLGRLVHVLVFDPESFSRSFVIPEPMPRRTAEQRLEADRRDAEYADSNITPITEELYSKAVGISEQVRSHPAVEAMLRAKFDAELSISWLDPSYSPGPLKGRLDYYSELGGGVVGDLKTCGIGQARPDKFVAIACGSISNYHWQAAWYARALKAVGLPFKHFLWIAAETDGPRSVSVIECNSEIIEIASREIDQHLKALQEHWLKMIPNHLGYGSKIISVETPTWIKERAL